MHKFLIACFSQTGLQLRRAVHTTIFFEDARPNGTTNDTVPGASYLSTPADAVGSHERLIRDRDSNKHVLRITNATADATTDNVPTTPATTACVLWVALWCVLDDANGYGGLWDWRLRDAAVAFFDAAQLSLDAAATVDAVAKAIHQS